MIKPIDDERLIDCITEIISVIKKYTNSSFEAISFALLTSAFLMRTALKTEDLCKKADSINVYSDEYVNKYREIASDIPFCINFLSTIALELLRVAEQQDSNYM
ncbi:MAG: hypothetical protein QXG39_02050 [Candidatus Aenigmatarchaeota archaeon]